MRTQIPEGYELLSGRSRKNARKAIATAKERGFPSSVVLTQQDGYLIPLGDGDPAEQDHILSDDPDGEPTELVAEKLEDLTVAQLKELAEKHEVDLGDATKKADIIAKINESPNIPVLESKEG